MHELRTAASGCRIWLVDLDASPRAAQSARLPACDRARLTAIGNATERSRRRAAYAALRSLLGACFGPRARTAPIRRLPGGAPRLSGIRAVFSLSHSGRYALVALARQGMLGVDLEAARALAMPAARRTQIAAAATGVGSHALDPSRDADVLQAWTRLEALAKATGAGIGSTLTALGVRAHAEPPAVASPARYPHIRIVDLQLPEGLYGAIALDARPHMQASPAALRR